MRADVIPQQDGYDAIDLSDNEIQRLENFPRMLRMRTLLLNNNLISRVADGLGDSMPDLDMLCLTGNRISSLTEINGIAAFKKLNIHRNCCTAIICSLCEESLLP